MLRCFLPPSSTVQCFFFQDRFETDKIIRRAFSFPGNLRQDMSLPFLPAVLFSTYCQARFPRTSLVRELGDFCRRRSAFDDTSRSSRALSCSAGGQADQGSIAIDVKDRWASKGYSTRALPKGIRGDFWQQNELGAVIVHGVTRSFCSSRQGKGSLIDG